MKTVTVIEEITVRQLVERLRPSYAQVANCVDQTWRGVVACQNCQVKEYEYDEDENLVYIWV